MFRPMTSSVSALLGLVANGHQAVHPVSSSPSKIPYGGSSPVRLQAGCLPRPSLSAHTRRPLIRGHPSAHRLPSLAPRGQGLACRSGAIAALSRRCRSSCRTLRPRGPWLASGLFCPAGSSLTMASSEALAHSRRLMNSATGLCPRAAGQRFPTLLCVSFAPCRLPYPGGSGGLDCCSSARGGLRPSVKGSAPATSHAEVGSRVAAISRLQSSLYAAARSVARPSPTRTFTFELSSHESPR